MLSVFLPWSSGSKGGPSVKTGLGGGHLGRAGTYHTCPRGCRVQNVAGAEWYPPGTHSPHPELGTALGPVGLVSHPGMFQGVHTLLRMPGR